MDFYDTAATVAVTGDEEKVYGGVGGAEVERNRKETAAERCRFLLGGPLIGQQNRPKRGFFFTRFLTLYSFLSLALLSANRKERGGLQPWYPFPRDLKGTLVE